VGTGIILGAFIERLAFVKRQKRKPRSWHSKGEKCNYRLHDGYRGLVGKTPMIELRTLSNRIERKIVVKVEYLNPGGTSKDRIAKRLLVEAEDEGKLKQGGFVVEGTSGSTGIALTAQARAKGYRTIIFMPDDQV